MIKNLVVVSDTHCGCRLALCPPGGAKLDDGGRYMPSDVQLKLWSHWQEFWKWVKLVTKNEPYAVVHNGDAIDGVHHNSTTQISHNLEDQSAIAYEVLAPVVGACKGRYYHIRGTEAHVGKSGAEEERLAKMLGAKPNNAGQHARYELWTHVGKGLVHCLHHIGTTSSAAHEASAVNAELTAIYMESARWSEQPPHVVVRSHRHRYLAVEIATEHGFGRSVVTPGWQGKTPFAWKIAGARNSAPQFGGLVIRWHDKAGLVVHPWVRNVRRASVETL